MKTFSNWSKSKKRRWYIALLLIVLICGIGIPIVRHLYRQKYRAVAAVRINPIIRYIVDHDHDTRDIISMYEVYKQNQMDLITSDTILQHVADELVNKELLLFQKNSNPFEALKESIRDKSIQVVNEPKSELIKIIVVSLSAQEAELIANTIMDAYVDYHYDGKSDDYKRLNLLDDKRKTLETQLQTQREVIQNMSNEFGALDMTSRYDFMLQRVSDLKALINNVESQRKAIEKELLFIEKTKRQQMLIIVQWLVNRVEQQKYILMLMRPSSSIDEFKKQKEVREILNILVRESKEELVEIFGNNHSQKSVQEKVRDTNAIVEKYTGRRQAFITRDLIMQWLARRIMQVKEKQIQANISKPNNIPKQKIVRDTLKILLKERQEELDKILGRIYETKTILGNINDPNTIINSFAEQQLTYYVNTDPTLISLTNRVALQEEQLVILQQELEATNPQLEKQQKILAAFKQRVKDRRAELEKMFDEYVATEQTTGRADRLKELQAKLKQIKFQEENLNQRKKEADAETITLGRKHLEINKKQDELTQTKQLYNKVKLEIQKLLMENDRPKRITVAYRATSAPIPSPRNNLTIAFVVIALISGILLFAVRGKGDKPK